MKDSHFHVKMGSDVFWDKHNTMVGGQIQYVAGKSGKKRDTVPPQLPKKVLQYYDLTVRQPPCQIIEMPFYATLV